MYCAKCQGEIEQVGGTQMRGCFHFLCTKCIVKAVKQAKTPGIRCAAPKGFYNCEGYIDHAELEFMVSTKTFRAYVQRIASGDGDEVDHEDDQETPTSRRVAKFTPDDLEGLPDEDKKSGWGHKATIIYELVQTRNFCQEDAEDYAEAKMPLLETRATVTCPICMDDEIPAGEGVVLKECLHIFCKGCLAGHIEHSDEPNIKCPYIDGNYSCVDSLQPREIRALVTDEVFEKYNEKSLKLGESSIPNSFHCKTPDCRGWCVYDEGVDRFVCPICKASNCIPCKAIHDGTCEDYKLKIQNNENDKLSEEAIEELVRSGEYMRCPQCKIPVKKIVGCDWVQCGSCRIEICWATRGPRWGPKGRGDLTGGCRCGLATGQPLCHPNCQNCH